MMRKRVLLLATIMAIVCASPSLAKAGGLTTTGGALLAPGSGVWVSSTNMVLETKIGNITCQEVSMPIVVTENTKEQVKAQSNGEGKTVTCFFKGTTPVTFDEARLWTLDNVGGGSISGYLNTSFKITLPKGLTCVYSSPIVHFTYKTGSNSIHAGSFLLGAPEACGTAWLTGDFQLSTTGGQWAILD